jgi:hypothetical protein
VIPSAFEVPVVPGEPRSAPCSIGTPSNPSCAAELEEAEAVVVVDDAAAEGAVEELDEDELPPHPAIAKAVARIELISSRLIAEGRER